MYKSKTLTETDQKIMSEMAEIRELLKTFGATLGGYDPGVLLKTEQGNYLDFSHYEWAWLKPLLQELLYRRTSCTCFQESIVLGDVVQSGPAREAFNL